MTPDQPHPLRKKIRLSTESYKQRCAYFVTICTHEKQCLLSAVDGQSVKLTKFGEIVRAALVQFQERFPGLALDEYILMPNHLHAILIWTALEQAPPLQSESPDAAHTIPRRNSSSL
jgi:REP element-mobilizing transposase RayT